MDTVNGIKETGSVLRDISGNSVSLPLKAPQDMSLIGS